MLTDVNIAVHSHVITNPATPLDVGQSANLKIRASDGLFPNRDTMARNQAFSEPRRLVENTLGANK
jgi:hypothetical protein